MIDANKMFEYPYIFDGRKYPTIYHENLYILNGLGARGFVLAPYLAKELANLMIEQKPIDKRADNERLFWNWVRKMKQ